MAKYARSALDVVVKLLLLLVGYAFHPLSNKFVKDVKIIAAGVSKLDDSPAKSSLWWVWGRSHQKKIQP